MIRMPGWAIPWSTAHRVPANISQLSVDEENRNLKNKGFRGYRRKAWQVEGLFHFT